MRQSRKHGVTLLAIVMIYTGTGTGAHTAFVEDNPILYTIYNDYEFACTYYGTHEQAHALQMTLALDLDKHTQAHTQKKR